MQASRYVGIESAKERFMGNNALFVRFLYDFPNRSLFGDLKDQLAAGDVKTAFATAHAMKGIAANLSLILIEGPLHDVVEALRAGNLPSDAEREALEAAYDETIAFINEAKASSTEFF